ATSSWGDETSSAGTVVSDGKGGFVVTGSHTYLSYGSGTVCVQIVDRDSEQMLTTAAVQVDIAVPTGGVPTPDQSYVGAAYENLLGRTADPSGLAAWSGLLDQGAPLPAVAS